MASEATERIATTASPMMTVFCPARSISIAQRMVAGRMKYMSWVKFSTPAMAIAPNATWESPSPISEKRLSTSVTPKSEAHSEISTPTSRAF